ncbi:hypothetical protein M5K25_014725 [Dendrobium thyrsiflorum]|uniref:SHSP domain-containing protein n=1 Tax=Dendrobium thyrsiflorum TaxID=117978 RepID=A0ABD0UVJ5_DENTH
MESNRARSFGPRSYEDFQPLAEWISDDISETLFIRLPGILIRCHCGADAGFSKEQLKVQMDNFGNLRAIGERPLDAGGHRWSRFQTEHPIPKSCDVRGVRARFDNNILYITFPKLVTEEPKPTVPPAPMPKPEPEPMPEPEEKKLPMPEKKLPVPEQKKPVSEQKQEPETQKKEEEVVKDKEKGEKELRSVSHEEKEKEAGEAAEAQAKEPAPAPEKMGIGFLKGTRRPSQVVVNMFVAVTVLVVIGIYVSYKLSSGGWGEWGKRRIVQYWRG